MEQRKWLSWNDVERLAARLETYSLSGAGGPRTCRVSCTSSRHRTGYGTKPPTEPTQHTETPVGTKSYRASYLGTDTVTRWLLEWLACKATPPE